MGQIHELSQNVINQIAAGEVIERPSSVVKELVENSLDAGADKVSVFIEDGGRTSIVVTDNGSGILPEDLPLAFKRHATSKIQCFEDLSSIRSMGFRGEALASIASVSKVSLRSVCHSSQLGCEFRISPEDPGTLLDWSGPFGTTVEVRDLFKNLPVRLKFLKTVATEQSQVVETLSLISMGYPHIQIHLTANNRTILSLPARSNRRMRLLDLYQGLQEEDFRSISLEGEGVRIEAEVLRPDKSRKDRRYQHFFLNERCIKSPALYQAISQGAGGYIQKDVQPGAWIWMDLRPDRVDVNVHPTKREVRFLEPERLFSLVRRAVREGFEGFSASLENRSVTDLSIPKEHADPSSPFPVSSLNAAQAPSPMVVMESSKEVYINEALREKTESGEKRGWGPGQNPQENKQARADLEQSKNSGALFRTVSKQSPSVKDMFHSLPDVLKSLPPAPFSHSQSTQGAIVVLGQVYDTFILVLIDSDLVLIDQHTAHERIRYDLLRKSFSEGKIPALPFLFPQSVRLSSAEVQNIEERIDELMYLGFDLDIQGPMSIKVSAIPALLEGEDPAQLLQELSESSHQFEWPLVRSDRIDETLMTLSCHTSLRANHSLGNDDLTRIVRTLLSTEYPYSCPHGRPTTLLLSRRLLEKWFQRT
ncbi:MAG: DNA mismatch repair endonuclease MutL [Leptospirales bacterium]